MYIHASFFYRAVQMSFRKREPTFAPGTEFGTSVRNDICTAEKFVVKNLRYCNFKAIEN